MAALDNKRHERFAQAIAAGVSNAKAYTQAGYQSKSSAIDVCASRLIRTAKVAARIAELQEKTAKKAELTAEKLIKMGLELFKAAKLAEDFSAASATMERVAKIAGLWVDRAESTTTHYTIGAPRKAKDPDQWAQQFAH